VTETFTSRAGRYFRTVGALSYYMGIVPMIRIPTLLPFVFATPFTILFILFVSGQPTLFAYGLSGAITMTVAQQGLFLGADLTNYKIEHKFQSIVVASPVSAFTYMFSVALSELAFSVPAIAVLLAILAYRTPGAGVVTIVGILVVAVLTWITTSSIGFFLSTYVLNTRTAFLTVTFISIILSILPPVFYPMDILPESVRWLSELVPTTHASVLIQGLSGLSVSYEQTLISWGALPAFTVAFLALALLKARWRET
jgi:ABC-2 type transport system permease protein